jgi:hypothetical protein
MKVLAEVFYFLVVLSLATIFWMEVFEWLEK